MTRRATAVARLRAGRRRQGATASGPAPRVDPGDGGSLSQSALGRPCAARAGEISDRQLRRRQHPRHLEEDTRVATGFGHDPIADSRIQRSGRRRLQQDRRLRDRQSPPKASGHSSPARSRCLQGEEPLATSSSLRVRVATRASDWRDSPTLGGMCTAVGWTEITMRSVDAVNRSATRATRKLRRRYGVVLKRGWSGHLSSSRERWSARHRDDAGFRVGYGIAKRHRLVPVLVSNRTSKRGPYRR